MFCVEDADDEQHPGWQIFSTSAAPDGCYTVYSFRTKGADQKWVGGGGVGGQSDNDDVVNVVVPGIGVDG